MYSWFSYITTLRRLQRHQRKHTPCKLQEHRAVVPALNMASLKGFYDSPGYVAARTIRQKASTGTLRSHRRCMPQY